MSSYDLKGLSQDAQVSGSDFEDAMSTQVQRSATRLPMQHQRSVKRIPSIWLRVVSWSFKIAGFVTLPLAALSVVGLVIGEPPYPPLYLSWWQNTLITASSAALLLRIGFLLAKRSREGGVTLLLLALYPFPLALLTKQPIRWEELVFVTVQLAIVASIWPQLARNNEPTHAK